MFYEGRDIQITVQLMEGGRGGGGSARGLYKETEEKSAEARIALSNRFFFFSPHFFSPFLHTPLINAVLGRGPTSVLVSIHLSEHLPVFTFSLSLSRSLSLIKTKHKHTAAPSHHRHRHQVGFDLSETLTVAVVLSSVSSGSQHNRNIPL